MPLHRGGIARLVVYISEKRKLNIFRGRAGQEFADAARRANQLTKNVAKWQQRRAFFSLPPAQGRGERGSLWVARSAGWRYLRKQNLQMNSRRRRHPTGLRPAPLPALLSPREYRHR